MRRSLRLAMRLMRVGAAAVAGAIVRFSRRLLRRRPRIWHGAYPLQSIKYLVRADRHAGYPSRSVTLGTRASAKYALVSAQDFDVALDQGDVEWDERHWVALCDLLLHGDIWSAFFDCLFFNIRQPRANRLAFRLIRAVGIRIVVSTHGSDIVQLVPFATPYDWIGRFQKDYPLWDFASQTGISRERIAQFCRFADIVLPNDSVLARLVPRCDILFKSFPIDTDELTPAPAAHHDVPRVLHAPNHRHVKGTDFLLQALERLRSRGFAFELQLVENVPRDEALAMYRECDIIADQFCIGAYGQFAFEGMALGKPVLTYLDEAHLGNPVFNLPIVNATPENLAEVLAVLLVNPELRTRLGEASRDAVVRYQSIGALAEVWDAIYRNLWSGEPLQLDRTQHFSPARTARATTTDPADPPFWPVDVADLMPRIEAALTRLR